VTFDANLFAQKDVGDYDVKVEFAQNTYVLHIKLVDTQAPQITFAEKTRGILYRIGQAKYLEPLYTVSDDHEVQSKQTPTNAELEEGDREICVTAIDAFENKAHKCKQFHLENMTVRLTQIPDAANVEELLALFMRQKHLNEQNFAFYYASPKDGEQYVYNGDTMITAASIIKIPLNMLYEDRYAAKTMDPKGSITLQRMDVEAGGGDTVNDYAIGASVPYAYLQMQSIENSDNTATNMLVRELGGFYKFREMIAAYSDTQLPQSFYTQNVVNMKYMLDVMLKLYREQTHYQTLIEHMKRASVNEYLQSSTDQFEIAQKYGMLDQNLHATGIVYTPYPYIVGIYTMNRSDGEAIIKECNEWLLAYQFYNKILDSKANP